MPFERGLYAWRVRLRMILDRNRVDRELDDELRQHVALETEARRAHGVPPAEARRQALATLGGLESTRNHVREVWFGAALEQMMTNVRLGFRRLFRTPVVTCVAVVSLALGIGPNAAIFSVFSQALLRPLPVATPERLVNLEAPGPKPGPTSCNSAGGCDEVFSYPMFRDLEREQTVFTHLAAHRAFAVNVAYGQRTVNGQGVQVSGSYFPALGLQPAAGRLFGPEVDAPIGGHPVAVLSHEFWRVELGGSRDVVGDAVIVNGWPLTIVGVAPAGFQGTTLGLRPFVFVPVTMRDALYFADIGGGMEDRRAYWAYLFARLRPEVSISQARSALEPLYRGILTEVEAPLQVGLTEETLARFVARPIPIRDGRRGQNRMDDAAMAPLLLLLAVTGVVLLIACANVANLLLARLSARETEMVVRLSIGASRRHLLTQLLTESCLLALLGGAAGLAFAHWTLDIVGAFLPPEAVGVVRLSLDTVVVAFAGTVSLGTGLLFGIFPALRATRGELVTALKDGAGQPGGARSVARFRDGLVVAQIALAMTLLVAAGLFIRSLNNVSRVDLGIRTDHVVTFRLSPVLSGYEPSRTRALFERVEDRLAVQPGVTGVTAAAVAVFAGGGWGQSVMVEGFEATADTNRYTRFNPVATGYFETLGVPLLAGRTFTDSDVSGAPRIAVVNEAFAHKFELGRDAVGARLGRGGLDADLDMEIVGLVGNTRYNVKDPDPPLLYVPTRQEDGLGTLTFYARTAQPPESLLRTVPVLMAGLDPTLPVTDLKTLPQQVREHVFLDRMITGLSAAFAGLATLLAAIGLYGVLAYMVAQRTRELGLRMALGATAARVRAMVLGQVGRMTLTGGALGLFAALGLSRVSQSMLYEVDGLPPAVIAAAVLALAAVALAAGFVPAHRAARVDPMEALRHP